MDSRIIMRLDGEGTERENGQMSTVKCEICNKEADSLFIVSHKKRGRIRICGDCLEREGPNLLNQKSCSCC